MNPPIAISREIEYAVKDGSFSKKGDLTIRGGEGEWARYGKDGELKSTGYGYEKLPDAVREDLEKAAQRALDTLKSDQPVQILRSSAAKDEAAFQKEINTPKSKDYGTGVKFDGLVCALDEKETFRPFGVTVKDPNFHDDSAYSRDGLEAYIRSQGGGRGRSVYSFTVAAKDVIGYSTRYYGQGGKQILAAGVLIRPRATISGLKKV